MRSLTGLVAVLVALVVAAAPAQATFPGRNGGIAYAQLTTSGDLDPMITERARLLVALPPLGSNRQRTLLDCGRDCPGTSYRAPSYYADGVDAVLLPAATADDGDPCFSHGGKRIAFTGVNDHGGTDLYTRRLGGGAAQLIIRDAGEPAWSSRDRLAYVRSGNVYTARPNGGARRWVTSGVSPDWSPSGGRLALVRPLPSLTFDGPTGRMYTVVPTGRDLRRVGRRIDVSHPVWSPDGRWVAYDGFDLGVYVKRLGSGAAPREVAPTQFSGESGSVSSFSPAWRP